MKIYAKLLTGMGIIVLALLAVVVCIVYQSITLLSYKDLSKETLSILQNWHQVEISSQNLLLATDTSENLEKNWNDSIETFSNSLEKLETDKRIASLGEEIQELVTNAVNVWIFTSQQIEVATNAYAEFKNNVIPNHHNLETPAQGLLQEIMILQQQQQIEASELYYFSAFRENLKVVTLSSGSFQSFLTRMDTSIADSISSRIRNAILLSSFLTLLTLIAAFIYINEFSRRLSRRARSVEGSMRRVAERDFTVLPGKMGNDEIGLLADHLSEVITALSGFFSKVRDSAGKVTALKDALSAGTAQSAAAVNEINKNIESIKERFTVLDLAIEEASVALGDIGNQLESFKKDANEQAASMEAAGTELSHAVDNVSAVAREISDKALNADELKTVVMDGGDRVQATNEIIKAISHDIEGIVEIIELIDTISEQTNLLSMNAAIESAHAGDAGKGFAVVAEEIRKLAESTQENAQRIGEALTSIADKIQNALETSETSSRAFESINADVVGFMGALEGIADRASATSHKSVQIVGAIHSSVEATKRFSDGTNSMYEKHRAIQEAMKNIQYISDETLSGITEIDAGSREILEGVVHVDEISLQSRENADILERAIADFKTTE